MSFFFFFLHLSLCAGTYYVRPRFGAVARVSTWLARQNEDEPIRRAQEAASLLRGERVLIKR